MSTETMGKFQGEPVAVAAFVRAAILCAVLFGVDLSDGQVAGVLVAVEAGLAMFTRSKVTPTPDEG